MFFAELVQEQWQEAMQLGTLMDPGGWHAAEEIKPG